MLTSPTTLEHVLSRLRASSIACKGRLEERIVKLTAAFAEDYDDGALSACAFSGLVDFLEACPSSGYPDVTATPAGDVYAEWRGPHGHLLTIEFLDSGEARYLVFRPNPKHPQRIDRLNGSTTIDALSETVAPLALATGLAA